MSTNNNHDDDADRIDVEHDDDAIESLSYSIIYDDDSQSDDAADADAAEESTAATEAGESDKSDESESKESDDSGESSESEAHEAAEASKAAAANDADSAEANHAENRADESADDAASGDATSAETVPASSESAETKAAETTQNDAKPADGKRDQTASDGGTDDGDADDGGTDDGAEGDIAAANAARVNATLKLAKTAAAATATAAGTATDADAGVAEPSLRLSARLDKELGGGREDEILLRSYPTFALNKVTLTDRKTGRNVLDRVDAACYAGHVYAMLVSSDEERIALMSVMTGLKVPSDGNVMVKSANIFELEPLELRGHRLGVIPQRYAVRTDLSAERNVLYAMDASGRTFLKPKPVIARELLEQVGFASDTPNARVGSLSALEQRKVAVARAIACEADVIIADEPTGGLSVDDSVDLLRVLRSLTHGEHKRAVVIVTSDPEVADTAYRTFVIGD
ncbi:ATP-binding cassette domain-containing protein [Bifidobacterium jacchi]|uniref:ATP-binding cassette domain-containing protein n=1 Tax=Bifidobacterium jacchi TaxID=2490545 RepID=A0A5N5RCU2_9BIFI|nr:ATP-binding cassette domain-containing protein [Bifidobacterium jacchi]KAB5604539.1 ATP-binding cassette domain-containing protein [Bifidobacterium jacchi]